MKTGLHIAHGLCLFVRPHVAEIVTCKWAIAMRAVRTRSTVRERVRCSGEIHNARAKSRAHQRPSLRHRLSPVCKVRRGGSCCNQISPKGFVVSNILLFQLANFFRLHVPAGRGGFELDQDRDTTIRKYKAMPNTYVANDLDNACCWSPPSVASMDVIIHSAPWRPWM